MNTYKKMFLPINCRYTRVFADKLPITTNGTLSDKCPIKEILQNEPKWGQMQNSGAKVGPNEPKMKRKKD
jgi:hypothetical protein